MNDLKRRELILDPANVNARVLQITEIQQYLSGTRFAVKAWCDDGKSYAVKGIPSRSCQRQRRRLYGRELFVEQMVGILGRYLSAPVPATALAELPAAVVEDGTWIRCVTAGICHAVQWVAGADDSRDLGQAVATNPANRTLVARLAVLIGWISNSPGDIQFLLDRSAGSFVFSVDHGLLALDIPIWPDVRRRGFWQGRGIRPHFAMVSALKQSPYQQAHEISEIRTAVAQLQQVTDEQISAALAVQPDGWGVTIGQRVKLMRYLQSRRDELVKNCLK